MSLRFLVLGATGRVGSLVLKALTWRYADALLARPWIGGLVRDTQRARAEWPAGATMVSGDLSDPASIAAAMNGVDVVFLASPVHPDMAAWQCHAVQAAAHAGVARIVKLSGSAWTMTADAYTTPTTVGAAHAQVEEALRTTQAEGGPQSICIRPNAFLQGMLGTVGENIQAGGDTLALALGDARVAFADVRDIALAAAHAMMADRAPPVIEVTGPAAYSGANIAAMLTRLLARPIVYQSLSVDQALARAHAKGASDFIVQHQCEVLTRLRQGAGSRISLDFYDFLGQPARDIRPYLEEIIRSCKHISSQNAPHHIPSPS